MSTTERRFGKYELQELLGRGGMAEVWKAFDTQLHRSVAIKLLHGDLQADPDFVSRFKREAQIIASLHHPNIVQIYDFYIAEDEEGISDSHTIAYMVMDYVKGRTLAHYIQKTSHQGNAPSSADIVRLFTPISLAIDYAHRQGMIHRDIKPANILLDERYTARNTMGEPVLSDFGLAKMLNAASMTASGTLFGTPLYISPEQVRNLPVSDQTDIYALGVILYEIFTGSPPFQGDSLTGIMMQHLLDAPPEPHFLNPQLSPALAKVILKSLAKDPRDRFPSAASLVAAMTEALNLPVPEDLRQAIAPTDTIAISARQSSSLDPGATILRPSPAPAELAVASSSSDETITSREDALETLAPARAEASSDRLPLRLPDSEVQLRAQAKSQDVVRGSAASPGLSPAPPSTPRKRRWVPIALVAALIVILAGSGLATFLVLTHHTTATPSGLVANSSVGQAFFFNSGQVNLNSNQGSNDKFQINLQNIPNPQAGKSYYAWLLPDKSQSEGAPLLLGKITVNHGVIHFSYAGDSQHSNLLATMSRFLITEEDANITPAVPSPDLSAWRYYAELPQTVPAGQTYSLLDHLRHLLAADPTLESLHLHGGLDIWTYRNTQSVQQWAKSAKDAWSKQDYGGVHGSIVMILDALDGEKLVQQDVPPGTPILADPQIAQIGLLEVQPNQEPPGYLYHVALHLNGVLSSPGATSYQRQLAVQINTGVNNVDGWLGQLRQDAVQVAKMSNAQLALPSTLQKLNAMVTLASDAFLGRNDPTTNQQQIGVSQIYRDVQMLATFDIKPYK